jgi:hypothetical protein
MLHLRSPLIRTGIIASGTISFIYSTLLVMAAIAMTNFIPDITLKIRSSEIPFFLIAFALYELCYYHYTKRTITRNGGSISETRYPLLAFVLSTAAFAIISFLILVILHVDFSIIVKVTLISSLALAISAPFFLIHTLIAEMILRRLLLLVTGRSGKTRNILPLDKLADESARAFNYSTRFDVTIAAVAVRIANIPELIEQYGESTVDLFIRQIIFLLIDRSRSYDIWGKHGEGEIYVSIVHVKGKSELPLAIARIQRVLNAAASFLGQQGTLPSYRICASVINPLEGEAPSAHDPAVIARTVYEITEQLGRQREETVVL